MSRRPHGFTLVELMVSVAIIGILSSVAMPSFRNYQYRTRQAERGTIMRQVKLALDDCFNREGKFPTDGGGGWSYVSTNANPDWSPSTSKRPWNLRANDDWRRIPFAVEGAVYYSYYVWAQSGPGSRYYYIYTFGDLDGDMVRDELYKIYEFNGAKLLKWDWGAQYQCDDCSYAMRFPWPAKTF